jgi:chromosome segregation ATPase
MSVADRDVAEIKLAELALEIEQLESSRVSLAERVERLRAHLAFMAQRTATMRASLDLVVDHLTVSQEELQQLTEGMREARFSLETAEGETRGFVFEADSLDEAVEETDNELENLSRLLLEGISNRRRGH